MKILPDMPLLKGFRFPREIITYAVWAYHRFALSTADVEDLLAERGVVLSREWAVRHRAVSIALACRTFSISEICFRYEPKLRGLLR